jgi:hypothetical protein
MAADDFFTRWSRQKSESTKKNVTAEAGASPVEDNAPARSAESKPLPTLDDVAALTPDSDFSAFLGRNVDESVKRSALKKLFSNPHFNVMDGLDIYIDDYNKFTPLSATMLASLEHAKELLNPGSKHERKDELPLKNPATSELPPRIEEVEELSETEPEQGQQEQELRMQEKLPELEDETTTDAADADSATGEKANDNPSLQGGS